MHPPRYDGETPVHIRFQTSLTIVQQSYLFRFGSKSLQIQLQARKIQRRSTTSDLGITPNGRGQSHASADLTITSVASRHAALTFLAIHPNRNRLVDDGRTGASADFDAVSGSGFQRKKEKDSWSTVFWLLRKEVPPGPHMPGRSCLTQNDIGAHCSWGSASVASTGPLQTTEQLGFFAGVVPAQPVDVGPEWVCVIALTDSTSAPDKRTALVPFANTIFHDFLTRRLVELSVSWLRNWLQAGQKLTLRSSAVVTQNTVFGSLGSELWSRLRGRSTRIDTLGFPAKVRTGKFGAPPTPKLQKIILRPKFSTHTYLTFVQLAELLLEI
ncbi:hypothetical protein B0H19DRAFT_1224846 [Mycena capillaripes]|nr:hypothetical protein B0H19DRAFT_1224846 [Mycena capillaripes]